jgi:hypothetical protein
MEPKSIDGHATRPRQNATSQIWSPLTYYTRQTLNTVGVHAIALCFANGECICSKCPSRGRVPSRCKGRLWSNTIAPCHPQRQFGCSAHSGLIWRKYGFEGSVWTDLSTSEHQTPAREAYPMAARDVVANFERQKLPAPLNCWSAIYSKPPLNALKSHWVVKSKLYLSSRFYKTYYMNTRYCRISKYLRYTKNIFV